MTTTKQKTFLAASATAISAIGLFASTAPAQARPPIPLAPPCQQWGMDIDDFAITEVGTGWTIDFGRNGVVARNVSGAKKNGTSSGGISGHHVDLTVRYGPYFQQYIGDIADDGHASGTTHNNIPNESNIGWNATGVSCMDITPVPEAPAQNSSTGSVQQEPVKVDPPAEAKPLKPPTIDFKPINLGFVTTGLEATITDRSGVASNCTYTSSVVSRDFALPANGRATVKITPLVPTGTTFDVNVTCDNGTSLDTTTTF